MSPKCEDVEELEIERKPTVFQAYAVKEERLHYSLITP